MTLKKLLINLRDHTFLPNDPTKPLEYKNLLKMKFMCISANFFCNFIAFILMDKLVFRGGPLPSAASVAVIHGSMRVIDIVAFSAFLIFALIYEHPIRKHLNNVYNRKNVWYKQYEVIEGELIETDVNLLGFTPNIFFSINLH